MKRRRSIVGWRARGLVAGLVLGAAHTLAQPALIAEPPPGKSENDQAIERFRCHEAAVKESRFNPGTAQAYVDGIYGSSGQAAPRQRGYFGRTQDPAVNMAGGAALGAAAGAMAGTAASGAHVGAVAGTVFGAVRYGGRARREAKHAQAQQELRAEREQEVQTGAERYTASWSTCMRELGYNVP